MVSNNRYLNTRAKMFDLSDQLNAANQCNARLMAEEFQLSGQIKDLNAEIQSLKESIESLNSLVNAKNYYLKKMDQERLKQVNEKRKLETELASLRLFISELAVDSKLESVCRHCRWCDEDGVSCNCPDSCFFMESEES